MSAELAGCSRSSHRGVGVPHDRCHMKEGHLMAGSRFIFNCLEEAWPPLGSRCCGVCKERRHRIISNDILMHSQ